MGDKAAKAAEKASFIDGPNMADEWAVDEVNEAVDVAPAFELKSDLPEVKLFGKWNHQERMKRDFTAVGPAGDPMRKASSGTLNRLILVAQALESEVDTRRKTEIHGGKIVVAVRMANIVVLCLINFLVFTGFGQYTDGNSHTPLLLTPDKWVYSSAVDLPSTFTEMELKFQFIAGTLTVTLLFTSSLVQLLTMCRIGNLKCMSVMLTISCVPCCLLVFGLQMHYSSCPWIDDYYLRNNRVRGGIGKATRMQEQCGVNGWALAGIFTLLSCALFVAEGLVTSFFRQQEQFRTRKQTMV
ncbi:hypothetical protein PRIPAC_75581 [Pristionchus pacificus]|uniref:Uncharacterized protein n=1 Tax=Pristionchus pacificus TaxID=54126 RepID=A0A2A6B529_PRIPA|nr:hypothetical protein PRIPAC_75581 [Pristionchus pacificus]|eukprot:PDM60987.1 hypothetical protein PRIPAC_54793 [Pristionchus pacificus]